MADTMSRIALAQMHLAISKALNGENGGRYIFVTKSRLHAWQIVWPHLKKLAEFYKWTIKAQALSVELPNGATLQILEANNDRTRGIVFDGVIFDDLVQEVKE